MTSLQFVLWSYAMRKSEKFVQLSADNWPNGLSVPIAQLKLLPADITRRSEIIFEVGEDDLGQCETALLRFASGSEIALEYHKYAPVQATTVLVHEGEFRAVGNLVRLLALKRREVSWIADTARKVMRVVFLRQREPQVAHTVAKKKRKTGFTLGRAQRAA
jgi:hypothetical protein